MHLSLIKVKYSHLRSLIKRVLDPVPPDVYPFDHPRIGDLLQPIQLRHESVRLPLLLSHHKLHQLFYQHDYPPSQFLYRSLLHSHVQTNPEETDNNGAKLAGIHQNSADDYKDRIDTQYNSSMRRQEVIKCSFMRVESARDGKTLINQIIQPKTYTDGVARRHRIA